MRRLQLFFGLCYTISKNKRKRYAYMEEKKKWPNANQYKWQRSLTLTKSEGAIMDEILSRYNCPNISQFCKKLVYEDIILSTPEGVHTNDNAALKVRLAECEHIITKCGDTLAECERTIADIKKKLNP